MKTESNDYAPPHAAPTYQMVSRSHQRPLVKPDVQFSRIRLSCYLHINSFAVEISFKDESDLIGHISIRTISSPPVDGLDADSDV